jgi:hypothetical protein
MFIADTGNHRIRRLTPAGQVTTVLGVGVAASYGEGAPARALPVDTPRGVLCDDNGNVFVSSGAAIRMLVADSTGVVDGTGDVRTIFGGHGETTFPQTVTKCMSGLAWSATGTLLATDACSGLMLELSLAAP